MFNIVNFVDMLSKLINALGIGGLIMLILITFGVQINSLIVINIAIISFILSYMFDMWQTIVCSNMLQDLNGEDDEDNN